ncbi:hypothetical protein PV04_00140 [Phialophora macrospora]|uniref:monoamine oxidase n=1 Tax=Phialophora macrospora TaxID=1851006 RepID=A0A0D2FTX6_9EURO|nr:hypothetical protein PV04_00140 [Phialophora macrospora]
MSTTDGFQYFPSSGLKPGLPTQAVVTPPARGARRDKTYDVIVIGAGYAGLVACRELASRGRHVLLIEARDRIGGRTFSAEFDGQQWDIGGTWMHWFMPHVYSELSRYGLVEQLQMKKVLNKTRAYTTLRYEGGEINLSPEEEARMRREALGTFFNVDGANGRIAMPTPHRDTLNLQAFRELSALSVRDRLDQVKADLTAAELAFVEGTVINWCGMDLSQMSFFDCMRWWALAGHVPDGVDTCTFSYKLACGQTGFARAIFGEAASHANFAYTFRTPVASISGQGPTVTVTTAHGDTYTAKHLISTIPWSVLDSITFNPRLPDTKHECFKNLSQGHSTKIYAEVAGSEWDAWQFISPSSDLTDSIQYMASTGCTPAGNARMVVFSLRDGKNKELFPDRDPEATMAAFKKVNPQLDIKRLMFHNWTDDPYTKGIWVMFRTGEAEKALPVLRRSVGNIHFASADWAQGWRGFIEGAIEQGLQASVTVQKLLGNGRLNASL